VQGRKLFYNGTPDDNKKACGMFEKAISLDPDYAEYRALRLLKHEWQQRVDYGR
jgi:hypothetical protein